MHVTRQADALAEALAAEDDDEDAMEEMFGTDRANEVVFGRSLFSALPRVPPPPRTGAGSRQPPRQKARAQGMPPGNAREHGQGRGRRCQRKGCTTIASFAPLPSTEPHKCSGGAAAPGRRPAGEKWSQGPQANGRECVQTFTQPSAELTENLYTFFCSCALRCTQRGWRGERQGCRVPSCWMLSPRPLW